LSLICISTYPLPSPTLPPCPSLAHRLGYAAKLTSPGASLLTTLAGYLGDISYWFVLWAARIYEQLSGHGEGRGEGEGVPGDGAQEFAWAAVWVCKRRETPRPWWFGRRVFVVWAHASGSSCPGAARRSRSDVCWWGCRVAAWAVGCSLGNQDCLPWGPLPVADVTQRWTQAWASLLLYCQGVMLDQVIWHTR
jgi:hypothetical protein